MPHIRTATLDDVDTIVQQRHQMFADNDLGSAASLDAMDAAFRPWLRERIAGDAYIGLLLSERADSPILAAAGIWFMDWPPHYLHAEPMRAYLLNFYTAPEARGRGYAKLLLDDAVKRSNARGATVVTLHASPMGRPNYEAYGFQQSNEMMLKEQSGNRRANS